MKEFHNLNLQIGVLVSHYNSVYYSIKFSWEVCYPFEVCPPLCERLFEILLTVLWHFWRVFPLINSNFRKASSPPMSPCIFHLLFRSTFATVVRRTTNLTFCSSGSSLYLKIRLIVSLHSMKSSPCKLPWYYRISILRLRSTPLIFRYSV